MTGQLLAQVLLNGLLSGLVYALVAVGLGLIFGVMDVVNFAHGEFMMLAMFLAYWLFTAFKVDPLVSVPLGALVFFGLGVLLYRLVIKRILTAPPVAQILATFGLSIFLQNLATFLWKPDFRLLKGNLLVQGNVSLLGVPVMSGKVVAALGAVLASAVLVWFLRSTRTGKALQATAINRQAAGLMGIDTGRMFALATGIGTACVAVAGVLLANYYYLYPQVGFSFSLIAYVVVALGGFGSLEGAFLGGIIIGLVESLSGFFLDPSFKLSVVFAIYLGVVLIRPKGLMGW